MSRTILEMKMRLNSVADTHLVPVLKQEGAIPRTIHQTFRRDGWPDEIHDNIAHLKALNPGWQYTVYDDADVERFIGREYSPQVLTYYYRIDEHYGAARADLFRYLLLYKCGGVYLDIKSSANIPFDEVIHEHDSYIIAQWPNRVGELFCGWGIHPDLNGIDGGEFQQWHIISVPGHPFLRAVIACVLANIDMYHPIVHGTGTGAVLHLSGPIAYTLAIHRLVHSHPHRMVRSHTELGLEYSIFGVGAETKHRYMLGRHHLFERRPVIKNASKNSSVGEARWFPGRHFGGRDGYEEPHSQDSRNRQNQPRGIGQPYRGDFEPNDYHRDWKRIASSESGTMKTCGGRP